MGDDDLRLTALNLYVKLRGMGLWRFVRAPVEVSPGCLNVLVHDVVALREALTKRWDFRDPEKVSDYLDREKLGRIWDARDPVQLFRYLDRDKLGEDWDSAEKRATASLHIKHFKGWPIHQIHLHIDHHGPWAGNKYAWCLSAPVTALHHGLTYNSYSDPQGARALLSAQGWDHQTLWGTAAGG